MQAYPHITPEAADCFRGGRSIRDGYFRGWGLQFGDLKDSIVADADWRHALRFAEGRVANSTERLMNLFLLIKFYLPKIGFGHIVEFGAYRAGAAFFMAALAQRFLPGAQVYALDSFAGMPDADAAIDAHAAGDFDDAQYDEICAARDRLGLSNLHLVRGLFAEIDRARSAAAGRNDRAGAYRLRHLRVGQLRL